ncbi:MAG: LytTR family DNA-binding domain-containing protein [Chitinophagales bacterium]
MINSIIIDDEQHCLETLQWQLEKYTSTVKVLQIFNNPIQALEYVKTNPVNLVFLDIEMPEINGFEFLNRVSNIQFDVIFTTAYDEFAVKAFKASAIDYLLKPIDKQDLINAIKKVENKRALNISGMQLEILNESYGANHSIKDKIAVPTQEGLHFIKIKDIVCCISDSNYTYIHLANQTSILVSRTLKEIESILPNKHFLRIHHSNLINLEQIKKYVRGDGGYVVMEDGKELSVSRSRKDTLLKMFSI